MGSIELFGEYQYFLITLAALGILFFSSLYATAGQDNLFGPLWLLFIGVVLDFCANGAAYRGVVAYAAGKSINGYVFTELLLLLLAMVFWALAAIRFIINNVFLTGTIVSLGVLGLLAIFLFIFIIPDGNVVNNMRQIFPLAGFACLSAGFWSRSSQEFKSGSVLTAILTSLIALILIGRFFGILGAAQTGVWFFPALFYILLSLSEVMMKVDSLRQQLEKSTQELDKYNQKIEEIIRMSPFPIIISRVGDDRIIMANNNAVKLFGINPRELERYRLKDFFADSDNRKLLTERLENEKEIHDFEVLVKTPLSNTPFWLLASVNIIDYNYDVVLYSAFQDITSRKNRENLLKNQAIRDPLTALYNRRYFEEEVNKQILEAKAKKQPYAVLMLDADHFKNVNDTYGHKVGDKVLIELATTAERALRDNDIVARYGGEEFVVFLPGIHAEQGKIVADRLRESISKQTVYSDSNQPVKFTVSIGVSSSEISDNVDTLIKTADEALYKAKQNGRNRVEVFTSADMKKFMSGEQVEPKDESQNHHPVFDKENSEEISLLDGVETGQISNETPQIEEPSSKKESK